MSGRTEAQMQQDNKLLDEVMDRGPDIAISWLRAAYHSHKDRDERWREKYNELSQLFLLAVTRPLTVREAQLCNVCRICRKDNKPNAQGSFLLNFGEEHSHESCLKEVKS